MILPCTMADLKLFGQMVQYSPTTDATGIKLVADGKITAMVAYDHWTPNAVQLHICITDPKSFSRSFVREALAYPFVQAGRSLLVGVTPSDNEEALEFNRRIGFLEKYRIKDGWEDGVDMVVQELRKSDCKWLRNCGRLPIAGALRPTSRSLRMANG